MPVERLDAVPLLDAARREHACEALEILGIGPEHRMRLGCDVALPEQVRRQRRREREEVAATRPCDGVRTKAPAGATAPPAGTHVTSV